MKNFAIVGAAGFVAPRHMKAIKETNNHLVAAIDPNDSVGILDSYFPECKFFTDFKEFVAFTKNNKDQSSQLPIHYYSICTPNYLHFDYIKSALKNGADAICEKPLVINPRRLDELIALEKATNQRVYSIFQLRLHPTLIALKDRMEKDPDRKKVDINLKYVTRRGPWYHKSWKGNEKLSGGLPLNIGIHFFDALIWMFGKVENSKVTFSGDNKVQGELELQWANVKWFLSIDINDLPETAREAGKAAFRSITIEGEELEFSDGFTDLHTVSYREILAGRGFSIEDARPALELVDSFRSE